MARKIEIINCPWCGSETLFLWSRCPRCGRRLPENGAPTVCEEIEPEQWEEIPKALGDLTRECYILKDENIRLKKSNIKTLDVKRQIKKLEGEIKRLYDCCGALKAENKEMERQLRPIDEYIKEIKKLKKSINSIKSYKEGYKQKVKEKDEELKVLREMVASLKSDIKKSIDELKSVEKELNYYKEGATLEILKKERRDTEEARRSAMH